MKAIRRKRVWIPILIGVVALALIGANLGRQRSDVKSVEIEKAERRSVEAWVRAPGVIQPQVSVDISSNVMGRVERLYVQEGELVQRGQMLLTLDDTRYRSAVAQTEAMLQAAESQRVLQEAEQQQASQVLARRRDLAGRGLLSDEALEQAEVDVRVQNARVEAQKKEVERLRAALAEAHRNLEETHFAAPIDGIVTALNLEEGENVVIGTMNAPGTVILTLADRGGMEVEAQVSESDVVRVRLRQRVRIEVDAEPDSVLEGEVTEIGESGNRGGREEGADFEVHARVTSPPGWLKTGMSADVEILVAQADSTLCVPIQALVARTEETVREWEEQAARGPKAAKATPAPRRDADPATSGEEPRRQKLVEGVFCVRDGIARFQKVVTGVRGEAWIALPEGIEPGAEIIVGPFRVLRHLKDGERVKGRARATAEKES